MLFITLAGVAEWQTQTTQNRPGNRVGSTPTTGTIKKQIRIGSFDRFGFVFCIPFRIICFAPAFGQTLQIPVEEAVWKNNTPE